MITSKSPGCDLRIPYIIYCSSLYPSGIICIKLLINCDVFQIKFNRFGHAQFSLVDISIYSPAKTRASLINMSPLKAIDLSISM